MKYFLSVFLIFNLTLFSVSAMLKPAAQAQMNHIICHCADMKKDSADPNVEYLLSCSSSEKNIIFHTMQLNVVAFISSNKSFSNTSEIVSTQYSSHYEDIRSVLEPPPPRPLA